MHVRVYYRQETINTYNRCCLWDFNEINSVNLAVLGKPHISIFSTDEKRHMFVWWWGRGVYSCDVSL
jgi:hypothetical protein